MKNLILLAVLAFSTSAFASGNAYTRVDSVIFAGSSMYVPANKTCIADGLIYHATKTALPVKVCPGNSDSESQCVLVMKKIVPQPVVGTFVRYENCQEDSRGNTRNCVAVAYKLDQSTKKIYAYSNDEDSSPTVVGTYTIPACASAK